MNRSDDAPSPGTTRPAPLSTGSWRELGLRLVLPGLVLSLLSAGAVAYLTALTENPFRLTIFYYLFRAHEKPVALLYGGTLLAVLLLASFVPAARCERFVSRFAERPWTFLLLVFTVLAAASLMVYRAHPLSMDEYAALFQAEVFASGRLTALMPPQLVPWAIPDFFVGNFFSVSPEGAVASRYWPGFSLLLAPFARLAVPWLLNPLLVVVILLLLRAICRELSPGSTAAGWAMLLAVASPELTVSGISYYSMNAHLAANLLFALLLLRPAASWRAFVAGVVGSFALVLHQPLPHALFALPFFVWLALDGRSGLRRLLLLAAGYLPLGALLLLGWRNLLSSLQPATAGGGSGGLGETIGGLLSVATGVFSAPPAWALRARGLEVLLLFLWAAPGLPLLALHGVRSRARSPWMPFALSLVVTCGVLLAVPFDQGHGWGPRYLHPAWGALPLLAAAGLAGRQPKRPLWVGAAAIAVAVGLCVATPLRFTQIHAFIDRHLAQLPPLPEDLEGSVVFLDVHRGYYAADLVQNDPFLRNRDWILVSHGRAADERLVSSLAPGVRLLLDNGSETAWAVPWADSDSDALGSEEETPTP